MYDPPAFLSLLTAARARRLARSRLVVLRKRLHEEWIRYEHARLVRVRHHLNVACLPRPDVAPWMYIWYFGTDENFMNVTSLSRASFNSLVDRFALFYTIQVYKPKGGRPRKLQHHHQVVGVLLAFYVGSMGTKDLCTKFGVPHSTLSRVLNDAEDALHRALSGFGPARIVWPTLARQKALARLTGARAPMLRFVWGFIDGKNYRVQQPPQRDLQNAHYNGWLHAVFVTGTLCFSCDGLIVWAKHNFPGSWNDSDTSLQFRQKLLDPTLNPDPRYSIIADSAFPCSGSLVGRIMTPMKDGDLRGRVPTVREVAVKKARQITFVRQSVEWGMGSIEKVFPLPTCKAKRKIRLDNLFRVANYRVRTVGVSQIRTTFVHGRRDNV